MENSGRPACDPDCTRVGGATGFRGSGLDGEIGWPTRYDAPTCRSEPGTATLSRILRVRTQARSRFPLRLRRSQPSAWGSGLHDVSARRSFRDGSLAAGALGWSLSCRYHPRAPRPLRHDRPRGNPTTSLRP